MPNPKVRPEDMPLFQQLVMRARVDGVGLITIHEYQQLEDEFIRVQGRPGDPGFLWGWGHRAILKKALVDAGVRVINPVK